VAVVALALVSAFLFALAAVLQQQVAARATDAEARQAGFLLRLVRSPRWLAGTAVDAFGGVLQAVALGLGRLAVVEPLSATTVVFALPLGRRMGGQEVTRRQALGAIAVTVGLGLFLLVADPSGGASDAPLRRWLVVGGALGGAIALLAVFGLRARPGVRAAMLGAAGGIAFGVCAGLVKVVVDELGDGPGAVLGNWHLYALGAAGLAATWLNQAALQAGALAPAVAATMAADPIASVLLGTLVLGESLHHSPGGVAASILALVLMVAGLAATASPSAGTTPTSPRRPTP